MSNIIKGLFGGASANVPNKKASQASKFCGICQEAFVKAQDDFKLSYCADCHTTGKDASMEKVAYWKKELSLKKANSLSPDMSALAAKLASNRALLEGNKFGRVAQESNSSRNLRDISASRSLEGTSLEIVRQQVAELLPGILSEQGLLGKVDAELLIDAIVPTKIASPIVDAVGGRSVLRAIVAETIAHVDMSKIVKQEALIRPHGNVKTADFSMVMDEGIRRVSNEIGTRNRRVANPMDVNPMGATPADEAFAAEGDPQLRMPPVPGNGPGDAPNDFTPSEEQTDESSQVVHLPDEQAEALVTEKGGAGLPPAPAMDPSTSPMPPEMMNEGVGTYSGGENQVPDASEMDEMPQEGIKRIENSASSMLSRKLSSIKTAKTKRPVDMGMFQFAGRVTTRPAEIIRLASQQRNVIESYPALGHYTASYSDGSSKTFARYATDKGHIYINDDFSIHSKSELHFAEFVESDPTFVRWAMLPDMEDGQVEVGNMAPEHNVEDMALPMGDPMGGGMGDPGFNEIKETHLNPSPNNSMGSGLAADQEAIFNNSDPGVGGPTLADGGLGVNPEDELLDTANGLMPHMERLFPDESPETHLDMAIEAALEMLESRRIIATVIKDEEELVPKKPANFGGLVGQGENL